jgi:hypothetical protein
MKFYRDYFLITRADEASCGFEFVTSRFYFYADVMGIDKIYPSQYAHPGRLEVHLHVRWMGDFLKIVILKKELCKLIKRLTI